MYLELYIYFTDNNVILFTLDDPDKDIHTINLYKYNLILYKTKCSINDIYITSNYFIKQFNLKQTLNDPSISPENSGDPVIYTVYLSTFTK